MKNSNEIILLKLGGSLLTDKNKPFSIREDIAKNAVQQIIDAGEKLILIHGGGSFGHPLAKKYSISKGINPSISEQILGLTETHQAMNNFNSYMIQLFIERGYPALSFQTSSLFLKESNDISIQNLDILETALDLEILPILYGDIILEKKKSFGIISGDQIIFELCKHLNRYRVSKVIFTMETDGLYVVDEKNPNIHILITDCFTNELDKLKLADLGQKIDVTGGIKGKLDSIKEISKFNIQVQLINGLKEGYIYKALKNQKLNCTKILTN